MDLKTLTIKQLIQHHATLNEQVGAMTFGPVDDDHSNAIETCEAEIELRMKPWEDAQYPALEKIEQCVFTAQERGKCPVCQGGSPPNYGRAEAYCITHHKFECDGRHAS